MSATKVDATGDNVFPFQGGFDEENNLCYEGVEGADEDKLCNDCQDFCAGCEFTCVREDEE